MLKEELQEIQASVQVGGFLQVSEVWGFFEVTEFTWICFRAFGRKMKNHPNLSFAQLCSKEVQSDCAELQHRLCGWQRCAPGATSHVMGLEALADFLGEVPPFHKGRGTVCWRETEVKNSKDTSTQLARIFSKLSKLKSQLCLEAKLNWPVVFFFSKSVAPSRPFSRWTGWSPCAATSAPGAGPRWRAPRWVIF